MVPTSVTVNGIIRLILLYAPNSIALQACYVTVIEDRPTCILSGEYHLPL